MDLALCFLFILPFFFIPASCFLSTRDFCDTFGLLRLWMCKIYYPSAPGRTEMRCNTCRSPPCLDSGFGRLRLFSPSSHPIFFSSSSPFSSFHFFCRVLSSPCLIPKK